MGEEKENEEYTKCIPVDIDMYVNTIHYYGRAMVNKDSGEVDLSAILSDVDVGKRAYFNGTYICDVDDILRYQALHEAGLDEEYDVCYCGKTGFYGDRDNMVWVNEDDEYMFESLTYYFDRTNEYYYEGDCSDRRLRDGNGDVETITAPDSWWGDRCYCDCCDCYLESEDDYYGDGECRWCHDEDEDHSIIEGYCESHEHAPIYFGDYKGEFAGFGFELEVDCDYDNQYKNEDTAYSLCSYCGLQDNEMRYAHDGSLSYGFECISQPHTVKDFWDKRDKWRKMLSYLASEGYKSHDAGTCGLHIHVSRAMFGKTEDEQDKAIAKVYSFFDDNWNDIAKISRRTDFEYCDKNSQSSHIIETRKDKFDGWRKTAKNKSGSHYVALNNSNSHTFEYRLGRGTLNAWSFFSWIDFILTITKNAKRLSIQKVVSNDRVSWLGGITESTAKYIYKRGAFKKEVLALYPNIEWEGDLTDNGSN